MKELALHRLINFLFVDKALCDGHITFVTDSKRLLFSACGMAINDPLVSFGSLDGSGRVTGRLICLGKEDTTFTEEDIINDGEWGKQYVATDLYARRGDCHSYDAIQTWLEQKGE